MKTRDATCLACEQTFQAVGHLDPYAQTWRYEYEKLCGLCTRLHQIEGLQQEIKKLIAEAAEIARARKLKL